MEGAGLLSRVTSWGKRPFSQDMSALDWFLFAGLVILIVLAWNLIINGFRRLVD